MKIVSDCCDARPDVVGQTTRYWICSSCGKACNVKPAPEEPDDGQT